MLLFYILSPLTAILLYTVYAYNIKTIESKHLWSLAIMIAVYLGLLNTTKEIVSDLQAYHYDFSIVKNYDIFTYLTGYGKEPLYYGYTYIGYYLFFGNWKLFLISITVINYVLTSYCIIKISKKNNIDPKNTIVALFIMAFFFQSFASTSQLIRQVLCQSITMVFLTRLYLENKKNWWIAVCAVLVHSSCIPILGLAIIPSIKERFTIKGLAKLIIPLGILIVIFYAVATYLTSLPFVGYIFARALNMNFGTDGWQTNVGLQKSMLALLLMLLYIAVFLYFKLDKDKKLPAIGLVNINIVLIFLLFLCNFIGAYFIQSRYFFFVYSFQNFIIVMFLDKFKLTNNNIVRYTIMTGVLFYFFYNYTHNIFSYSSFSEAVLKLLPEYFI